MSAFTILQQKQHSLCAADYFKKTKGRGHEYQNKVSLLIMVLTWWISHPVAYAKVWQDLQAQAALLDQMGQPRRHHGHSPRQQSSNQELGV